MGREVRQGRKKPIKGTEMNVVTVVGTWGTIPMGSLRNRDTSQICMIVAGSWVFIYSPPLIPGRWRVSSGH